MAPTENPKDKTKRLKRLPRSCDSCRSRKIRCDSNDMPGNVCTNCKNGHLQCTHVEATKSLGSSRGYVESLENRLAKLEEAMKRLNPNIDLNKIIGSDTDDLDTNTRKDVTITTPASLVTRNDDQVLSLSRAISKLMLNDNRECEGYEGLRFFGRSCGLYFVQAVLEQRSLKCRTPLPPSDEHALPNKRLEFWSDPQFTPSVLSYYVFPTDDILGALVDLYFLHYNDFLPLLHRPTFQQGIDSGLHMTDPMFGGTVLLVCAIGARMSDDLRVLLAETQPGWMWYSQVDVMSTILRAESSLYDIQMHILAILYTQTLGLGQTAWERIGIALRRLLDRGAHLKKESGPVAVVEMWKRAFWILFYLDVSLGSLYGRPFSLRYEDFDIEYPLQCDDEYWFHSDLTDNFKQPTSKPSKISYFVELLHLTILLLHIKNTIYPMRSGFRICVKQFEPLQNHGALPQYDSHMNKWLEACPDHLKWNPEELDKSGFFQQSAFLHITYHYNRLMIHRPFIPTPSSQDVINLPSVIVCMNAARSCLGVVQAMVTRERVYIYNPEILGMVETASLVLLLEAWGRIDSKLDAIKSKSMVQVHDVLSMVRAMESKIAVAGVIWDVLSELVRIPDSLPDTPSTSKKRTRSSSLTEDALVAGSSADNINEHSIFHTSEQPGDFGYLGPDVDMPLPDVVAPSATSAEHFEVAQKMWDEWAKDRIDVAAFLA